MTVATPEAVLLQAASLRNDGRAWGEIEDATGVSRRGLQGGMARAGIPFKHRLPRRRPCAIRIPTSEADLGYIAGLVDGEGSITIIRRKSNNKVCVSIVNTHRPVLEWLVETVGGCLTGKHRNGLGTKPVWIWQISALEDTFALLTVLEPHLRIKRERATAALAFLRECMRT